MFIKAIIISICLSFGSMGYIGYTHVARLQANNSFIPPGNTVKPESPNASTDLEIIRERIVNDLLESPVNSNSINQLVKSIQADGSWPGINYKDVSRTGFEHSKHLENMLELGRAWRKKGSEFYKNEEVRKVVSSALDFWISHDFICENWWWNEMGTPNWMINTLLVLDTALSEKQRIEGARIAGRANLEASGARPGGDLIQIAAMLGKQALFSRKDDVLERVVKVMSEEIKITTGRGMKPDLSFHHRVDNVISTTTYGTGYASSFAYWAVKIAGTKFRFPEEAMKLLIDYYIDGISKSMAYSRFPDPGAKNRDLSRKAALSPIGSGIPENLLLASNYRKDELENIIKIRKGEKEPNLKWNRFFWHSEYLTHQRRDYFTSVRMHSSRGSNMEQPHNEEGLLNHHFADGSNFITRSGKEYFDIFPVWDWQKIPGTTIIQKPALPHWREIAKKGRSEFVGSVTDGEYGAAAFDFTSVHDSLRAHKSWFFFDSEYVCLGSDINTKSEFPVYTTLNQCLLNGVVVAGIKLDQINLSKGEVNLKSIDWVLHDGVAYIFPKTTNAKLINQTVTGNWRAINHQAWATEEPVKKDVFCLWLDHGVKPVNAGYEYFVVPNLNPQQVKDYRKNLPVQIVSNNSEVQAVFHKNLKISQAVFYKAGSLKLNDQITITVDKPCMVMVKEKGNQIEKISVSDPSRKQKSIQLKVSGKFQGSGNNWKAEWNANSKTTIINVDLPIEGYAGKTVTLQQ